MYWFWYWLNWDKTYIAFALLTFVPLSVDPPFSLCLSCYLLINISSSFCYSWLHLHLTPPSSSLLSATSPSCRDACKASSKNTTCWPGRGSAIVLRNSSSSSVNARPRCVTSSSNTWWAWRCYYLPSTLSASRSPISPHARLPSLSWATRASSGQKGKRREQRRWVCHRYDAVVAAFLPIDGAPGVG